MNKSKDDILPFVLNSAESIHTNIAEVGDAASTSAESAHLHTYLYYRFDRLRGSEAASAPPMLAYNSYKLNSIGSHFQQADSPGDFDTQLSVVLNDTLPSQGSSYNSSWLRSPSEVTNSNDAARVKTHQYSGNAIVSHSSSPIVDHYMTYSPSIRNHYANGIPANLSNIVSDLAPNTNPNSQ